MRAAPRARSARRARARARAPGAARAHAARARRCPSSGKRNSKWGGNHRAAAASRARQVGDDALEVGPHEVRQHEAVVQRRCPSARAAAVGPLPEPGDERADEQLLGKAHAHVRRHLEGAELDEAEAAHGPFRRVELVDADLGAMRVARGVDEQVAEQAVDQPGRDGAAGLRHLGERDLELVEGFVARLVDARRLAGRPDEQARRTGRRATGWFCQ